MDYTGQTNLGSPYSTRTDEMIADIALRLGRRIGERIPVTPYLGIGYRRWDRDILPGTVGWSVRVLSLVISLAGNKNPAG